MPVFGVPVGCVAVGSIPVHHLHNPRQRVEGGAPPFGITTTQQRTDSRDRVKLVVVATGGDRGAEFA